jgi:hypothetical protein
MIESKLSTGNAAPDVDGPAGPDLKECHVDDNNAAIPEASNSMINISNSRSIHLNSSGPLP